MIAFWPCANPECDAECTSIVLDDRGLCPSCSFNARLDAVAAKRALARPDLWDDAELDEPQLPKPEPFPWGDVALVFALILLFLAFMTLLPGLGPTNP